MVSLITHVQYVHAVIVITSRTIEATIITIVLLTGRLLLLIVHRLHLITHNLQAGLREVMKITQEVMITGTVLAITLPVQTEASTTIPVDHTLAQVLVLRVLLQEAAAATMVAVAVLQEGRLDKRLALF